jgi:hypothetical protein
MAPGECILTIGSLISTLEVGIPSIVLVWVRLPHLPLHCWGDDALKCIRDSLGKGIDKSELGMSMYTYAIICVEVDLEKGLLEAIKLSLDGWTHVHKLDYEKLPFKCKSCHEYGHFAETALRILRGIILQMNSKGINGNQSGKE